MDNDINNQNNKDAAIQGVLRLLDEYHNYLNGHDLEGVIGTIHSSSPAQGPTRQMFGQMFNAYRLKNELLDTRYIGMDDDYVYIKMKQKVSKLQGPEFRDFISGALVVAKKDKGDWKVWSIMPLEMTFCDMPNTGKV